MSSAIPLPIKKARRANIRTAFEQEIKSQSRDKPNEESAMSEVIYLDLTRISRATRGQQAQHGPFGPRVFVREAQAGIWIVHDEFDGKGGCFCDRDTAFRFVEDEFGTAAEIVVQPRFSASATQQVSHFKQSTTVAHKAVVVG